MSVIDASNFNPWNALPKVLTAAAKTYKGAVDNSYYAVLGIAECTYAGAASACDVWKRGFAGNLKEAGKSFMGINDLSEAKAEIGRSVRTVGQKEERVPLPERIGKASAHVVNGVAKAVTTTCVGGAYGSGVVLNALGVQGQNGSLTQAATMTATGLNTVAKFGFEVASGLASPVSKAVGYGLSSIGNVVTKHPAGAAATVVGGAFAYAASHQAILASESKSSVSQAAHGTLAVLSALTSTGAFLWSAGIGEAQETIVRSVIQHPVVTVELGLAVVAGSLAVHQAIESTKSTGLVRQAAHRIAATVAGSFALQALSAAIL